MVNLWTSLTWNLTVGFRYSDLTGHLCQVTQHKHLFFPLSLATFPREGSSMLPAEDISLVDNVLGIQGRKCLGSQQSVHRCPELSFALSSLVAE